jgi:hypothetical protein
VNIPSVPVSSFAQEVPHSFSFIISIAMTVGKQHREENHRTAFHLMLGELGDRAIDSAFFDPEKPPFHGQILRTTWEELVRQERIAAIGGLYRLTPSGWLVGLEISGDTQSKAYQARVGRLLAAMKRHVKPRKESAILTLKQLADESGEPEGWIFNIIESRVGSTEDRRTGACWYAGEKGRLVEIPVDFNLEPIDVTVALTERHLQQISKLEDRLAELEEERQEFHCPSCDAPLSGVHQQDYIEEHCIVTYEVFACGYTTADGFEEQPCPYGPNWPTLDEFTFVAEREKSTLNALGIVIRNEDLRWVCWPTAKTPRARRVHAQPGFGRTKEEAEEAAKKTVTRKEKKEES